MIARLAFYAVEAAALACIAAFALALAASALRRLGAPVRLRLRSLLPGLWLAFVVVGVVFGERVGPEFVLPYHFCFWLVIGCGALWLLSFARRGARAGNLRGRLPAASGRGPE